MRISSLLLSVAVVVACAQAPQEATAQEGPKVIQIVAIDTGGDLPKFLEFSKRIQAIAEKVGNTGERRIWRFRRSERVQWTVLSHILPAARGGRTKSSQCYT